MFLVEIFSMTVVEICWISLFYLYHKDQLTINSQCSAKIFRYRHGLPVDFFSFSTSFASACTTRTRCKASYTVIFDIPLWSLVARLVTRLPSRRGGND
jgi:hypothetical protein